MFNPPNPGSQEAIALGCVCGEEENGFGDGDPTRKRPDGSPQFWIALHCPVHVNQNHRGHP